MDFPSGYVLALTTFRREQHFPNLGLSDFEFTSLRDEDYNCVAWGLESKEDWIQFKDEEGNYDLRICTYLKYFEERGYSIITDLNVNETTSKVAIYFDNNTGDFKHVSRQLDNGRWTSKIGDWEDLSHSSIEVLLGKSYGNDFVLMQKNK